LNLHAAALSPSSSEKAEQMFTPNRCSQLTSHCFQLVVLAMNSIRGGEVVYSVLAFIYNGGQMKQVD
jgi:hypothetical protein